MRAGVRSRAMSSLADTVAHFAALLQDGEGGPRAAEAAALVAALCAARHIQIKVGDCTAVSLAVTA